MNPKSRMIWLGKRVLKKTSNNQQEGSARASLRAMHPHWVTAPSAWGNGTGCGAQRAWVRERLLHR